MQQVIPVTGITVVLGLTRAFLSVAWFVIDVLCIAVLALLAYNAHERLANECLAFARKLGQMRWAQLDHY